MARMICVCLKMQKNLFQIGPLGDLPVRSMADEKDLLSGHERQRHYRRIKIEVSSGDEHVYSVPRVVDCKHRQRKTL